MAPVSRPAAIIFDWDNTLVDSWPTIHAANNAALVALGHEPWTRAQSEARVRKSLREAYLDLFGERWEEARDVYYAHFRANHLQELAVLAGRADMLGVLADAGIYMGIVSNKDGALLREEVAYLGWGQFFGAIVGANDTVRAKPAPEPLHLSLEPGSITAGREVWFVGDTDIDMECAIAGGVVPVLLREKPPETGEFDEFSPELRFTNGENFCAFLELAGN
ncbi:MAG: HAD-IA family hydrolase [Rhodospirillaceae bacterium]|jgi:phosphoglycolate phosphatase|nr:HAD-IA family hydrolase [Rhodospirillaceae bacterium]MBT3886597.1 HAD-IA family hydrolase [Rhodospirillaceae bacterium]MBT4115412.1 HAD-IA family hydrolase [Rhodospirillaceae bacterium]MBT4671053.1 HAD-IA family hydrolase [Rhodospirillaceae bacterium]MBT4721243.1 HAD-IA family hydrolase [Rhodospirillaceae bacterium]